MSLKVDQAGASARGDIVGRDKYEQHFHSNDRPAGVMEQLLQRLQMEVANNESVRHTVEALAHFQNRRSHDGIDGLQAKLKAANRSDEYLGPVFS